MDKKLTPKTANTFNKVCKLKKDSVSTRKSWMSVGGATISIYNQKKGESSTGNVTLTKKEFERFIKFYDTGI
jgi:hypothetical protein